VQNGTSGSLRLWGGIAVDPATNQAFVVESGSTTAVGAGQIEVINLGALKAPEITEVVVPSPNPGPGTIGGIAKALVPQGTLTSTTDLAGVQIFGSGFAAGAQVNLDGTAMLAGNVQVNANGRQIYRYNPGLVSFDGASLRAGMFQAEACRPTRRTSSSCRPWT